MTPQLNERSASARSTSLAGAIWLAGICALGPMAAAANAIDAGPEPQLKVQDSSTLPNLTEILDVLSSTEEGSEGRGLALTYLASRGPRSVPAITAILSGSAAIPDELQKDGPLLTSAREALLFEAMRTWDTRRVARELRRQLEAQPSLALRALSIRILGETGDGHSLEALLDFVAGLDPVQLAHPSLRKRAVKSMAAILRRDELSYVVLAVVIQELPAPMVDFSIEGIAKAGRADGVYLLESLLDRDPLSDEKILAGLACIRARDLSWIGPEVRAIVRPFLSSVHPGCRIQAARTLGALGDPEAFVELVELLGDPEPRVVDSALAALQAMSGTAWSADPANWMRWYRRESAWARGRGRELTESLAQGPTDAAVKAIRELTLHPLFTDKLAESLGAAANHNQRAVAILACDALGRLGSPDVLYPLVQALYDPRADVREAAVTSLRIATGEDLPEDGAAWRDWLEG